MEGAVHWYPKFSPSKENHSANDEFLAPGRINLFREIEYYIHLFKWKISIFCRFRSMYSNFLEFGIINQRLDLRNDSISVYGSGSIVRRVNNL